MPDILHRFTTDEPVHDLIASKEGAAASPAGAMSRWS